MQSCRVQEVHHQGHTTPEKRKKWHMGETEAVKPSLVPRFSPTPKKKYFFGKGRELWNEASETSALWSALGPIHVHVAVAEV